MLILSARNLLLILILSWLAVGCAGQAYKAGPRVHELRAWGEYAEAEAVSRAAVKDLERTNGPDNMQTLTAVDDLTVTLVIRGNYREAESLLRGVLARYEASAFGLMPSAYATGEMALVTAILATTLRHEGKYAEAEATARRARSPAETLQPHEFGFRGGEILRPLSEFLAEDVAATLAARGEYAEAEDLYRSVLREPEGWFPDMWSLVVGGRLGRLQATGDLALVLAAQARYGEAEVLARQAVADSEHRLGPNHPQTLEAVSALARVLDARGRCAEAEPMHRRVVRGFEREYGADHPLVARALSDLGANALRLGNVPEAEVALERSLAIRELRLGAAHPDTAESLARLGEARAARGALSEAEDKLRRALIIERESLGDGHPRFALTLVRIGAILHERGNDVEALTYTEQALAIEEKRLPPGHPALADTLDIQTSTLRALEQLDRAAATEARARRIRAQEQAQ